MRGLVLIFLTLVAGPLVPCAQAQRAVEVFDEQGTPPIPTRSTGGAPVINAPAWTDRLHLLAGVGANVSTYSSRFLRDEVGYGFNLKTDLGFELGERWAFDLGSSLKFNVVEDLALWDTLLTAGFRYHFEDDHAGPYLRGFLGIAPTVLEIRDHAKRTTTLGQDIDRIVFDGDVAGLSIGWSPGPISDTYFLELTFSQQTLRREKAIENDDEIPVVVRTRLLNGDARIYSLALIWGARIF